MYVSVKDIASFATISLFLTTLFMWTEILAVAVQERFGLGAKAAVQDLVFGAKFEQKMIDAVW